MAGSDMRPYDILIADDHTLFRQGIRRILEEQPDLRVLAEAADGIALMGLLDRSLPDLVLLDIAMPNIRGPEAAREIKTRYREVKILMLTMHRDIDYYRAAVAAGVEGYLLKEDADTELLSAITALRNGDRYVSPILFKDLTDELHRFYQGKPVDPAERLTNREREIVKLIAEGRSSKETGELLNISHRTVQNHRANVMRKLKLKRTADLVRFAILQGYIDL
jgi:DNA-binding NarL/FixJ family response regulator